MLDLLRLLGLIPYGDEKKLVFFTLQNAELCDFETELESTANPTDACSERQALLTRQSRSSPDFFTTLTPDTTLISRFCTTIKRTIHDMLATLTTIMTHLTTTLSDPARSGYGSSTCGYCSPVGRRSETRSSRSFGSESSSYSCVCAR